jgi:hypothetical protein
MSASSLIRALTAALILISSGCNQLEYTQDGVPIAPFGSIQKGDSTMFVGNAKLSISAECWLNFMPGPRPETAGAPLHVALRVAVIQTDSAAGIAHLEALTLWSETGDSVLASFPLINTNRGKAEVPLQRRGTTELTNDPKTPRHGVVEPDILCAPRLLLSTDGKRRSVSLPNITVQAVY